VFGLAPSTVEAGSLLVFTVCVFLVSLSRADTSRCRCPCSSSAAILALALTSRTSSPNSFHGQHAVVCIAVGFETRVPWHAAWACATCVSPAGVLRALVGLFCTVLLQLLYVGAYMYFDQRAPAELKSSAQSLVTFLLIGVGMFVGSNGGGQMMKISQPRAGHGAALGDASARTRDRCRRGGPDTATGACDISICPGPSAVWCTASRTGGQPDMAAAFDPTTIARSRWPKSKTRGGDIRVRRSEISARRTRHRAAENRRRPVASPVPDDQLSLTRKQWLAASPVTGSHLLWRASACFDPGHLPAGIPAAGETRRQRQAEAALASAQK